MRSSSRILSATLLIAVNTSLLFAEPSLRRGEGGFPTPPPVYRAEGSFPTPPPARKEGGFPTPPPVHAIHIAG
jgi:hypothetical protein